MVVCLGFRDVPAMYHELIGTIKIEDPDTVDVDELKEIKSEIEKQTTRPISWIHSIPSFPLL